jgi:hypothetical protein
MRGECFATVAALLLFVEVVIVGVFVAPVVTEFADA